MKLELENPPYSPQYLTTLEQDMEHWWKTVLTGLQIPAEYLQRYDGLGYMTATDNLRGRPRFWAVLDDANFADELDEAMEAFKAARRLRP